MIWGFLPLRCLRTDLPLAFADALGLPSFPFGLAICLPGALMVLHKKIEMTLERPRFETRT